jgi:serine protease AprX
MTLVAVVGLSTARASLSEPKRLAHIDSDVRASTDAHPRVIVRYKAGAESTVQERLRRRGHQPSRRFRRINAFGLQIDRVDIDALATDPEVVGISSDAPVRGHASDSSVYQPDGQQLRQTLAITKTLTGSGVGIAVIDSGIAWTPDLERVVASYDFTTPSTWWGRWDEYGHGTHIAGLIAGNGYMSWGKYLGVAPKAKLISLKVLDGQGQGYTSNVISAIEFAIDNRSRYGIDIINLSLGHPIFEPAATDPLVQAVEDAVAAGIVVVVAAGNYGTNPETGQIGYGGIASPGNAPSALTVGATKTFNTATRLDDQVAPYSSRGPSWYDGFAKPDIVAPGHGLVAISSPSSTLYANTQLRADVPSYLKLSGTSMATAVTTGVVALMIEANRLDEANDNAKLTPNLVKAILQFSALPLADDGVSTNLEQGAGQINADGAIALATAIDPLSAVSQPWLETSVTRSSTIAGKSLVWAQQIVWGDHIVLGDSVMANQSAWALQIVWGDSVTWDTNLVFGNVSVVGDGIGTWASSLVWGSQIVWGDQIVWGNQIVWGDADPGVQ